MTSKINVRPSELTMPVYQRDPNPTRVNRMATNFDPDALGAITVSRRENGTLVVVDGGHRTAACRVAGYNEKILAIVHDRLTLAEEASLFLSLNDMKAVGAVDKYRASVHAQDPDALLIEKIVTQYGWTIHKIKANGRINAIGAIYRALNLRKPDEDREDILNATISVITSAWGLDSNGVQKPLIEGVAKVLYRYPNVDRDRVRHILSGSLPKSIQLHGEMAAGASGWSKGSGVAAVIVDHYNTRLRTGRLDPWIWKN